jgi:hypothetical protein
MRDPLLQSLVNQLGSVDKDDRVEAALNLGRSANASALEALLLALRAETDFFVRETIT